MESTFVNSGWMRVVPKSSPKDGDILKTINETVAKAEEMGLGPVTTIRLPEIASPAVVKAVLEMGYAVHPDRYGNNFVWAGTTAQAINGGSMKENVPEPIGPIETSSSMVSEWSWEDGKLSVTFANTDKRGIYHGVPRSVVDKLQEAESVGGFMHQNVIDTYDFEEIKVAEEPRPKATKAKKAKKETPPAPVEPEYNGISEEVEGVQWWPALQRAVARYQAENGETYPEYAAFGQDAPPELIERLRSQGVPVLSLPQPDHVVWVGNKNHDK